MALTNAQKLTLRTHIQANQVQLTFGGGPATISSVFGAPILGSGDALIIADWYNLQASPNFTVWKSRVSITEIGDKINGTELAGLSTLNSTRLQTVVILSADGVNPGLADRRAFFDDIFSGAGGTITRANLLILWKRLATNLEKVFATGTGSDAVPALLVLQEIISGDQISDIKGLA